jgi:hypothetical protein
MDNFETRKAWRQALKEGDGVVITESNYRSKSIAVVQRITATQVIVIGDMSRERRFNKSMGREVGSPYGASLSPITAEARAQIQAAKNRQEFGSLTYRPDRLADDEIAVMLEALKALHASKEAQGVAP